MFKRKKKEPEKAPESIYDSMVKAKDIIKNPELIDDCPNRYWIIYEESVPKLRGQFLEYMQKAINIFEGKGWGCITIAPTAPIRGAFALMRRTT